MVTRQEIDLDQIWNKEAAQFREASQVSEGVVNLLGTLIPMSACLHYTTGNRKKKFCLNLDWSFKDDQLTLVSSLCCSNGTQREKS